MATRIRTLNDLQDALDQEMGWRLKEIAVFINNSAGSGPSQRSSIRAGVALLYAHWEGFVKASSEDYLEYVVGSGATYAELKSCFAVLGLRKHLGMLSNSNQADAAVAAWEFILAAMPNAAAFNPSGAVRTKSNLSSSVFSNIAHTLGIDTEPYSSHFNLIDSSLVDRRNKIAHGEYLEINYSEFKALAREITSLMRQYKTDLTNAAAMKTYLRSQR